MPDDLCDMTEREIGVVELNCGVARAEEVVRLKGLDKSVASLLGDVACKIVGDMVWEYPCWRLRRCWRTTDSVQRRLSTWLSRRTQLLNDEAIVS